MTNDQMPEELRAAVDALQEGPLDEDSQADGEELSGDEDEYIDADDLLALLTKMQETLDEQSKELRGLRREMRELREQMNQGQGRGGFQRRDDRGEDRGFRPRQERQEGFAPRGYDGGDRGGDRGGFQRRDDRGGDREFRPREDRAPRSEGSGGDFRPRARRDHGWNGRKRDE